MLFEQWFDEQPKIDTNEIGVECSIIKTVNDEYYIEILINDSIYFLEVNCLHNLCKGFGTIIK